MYSNKILSFIIIYCILIYGCDNSYLNVDPHDRYTQNNFWQSSQAANAALTGCYAVLRYSGVYGGTATPLWEETASPNAYNYSNSDGWNSIAEGLQSSTTGGIISSRWANCYEGIGRCNYFLANVDRVTSIDEATRTRMKGEAYFLRALFYFLLENYWGDVPLILDPPDPSTQSNLPRTSRQQIIEQILKDLDSATLVLPLKYGSSDLGRVTKGAAMALKARVLLFEASPLFNTNNDKNKWKLAADAAKAVIDISSSAGYGLYPDYRSLFLPENENNKEVIFDVQFIYPQEGNSFDLICGQYNSNAPLLDLVQSYEMKNGLPISDPSSGYRPDSPYLNRDPRLYATIVYPGEVWVSGSNKVTVTSSWFPITGYAMQKLSVYNSATKPPVKASDIKDGQSYINYIVIRYADVLLMYAEAQNEFIGPDPSVYAAVNQIRARVGMPNVAPGLTQDSMRQVIRHERRIEFAGEGLYYNDIRRWKIAELVMNSPIYTWKHTLIETRRFNPNRDYWWPIPQTQLDLNHNLVQNSGY